MPSLSKRKPNFMWPLDFTVRCALGNRREEGQKKYTLSHCMLVLHFTYQLVKSYLISNARNSNSVRRPHKVSENLKDDLLLEMEGNSEVSVFENHRKSLVQHCERSELRLYDLYFEWIKREAIFGQTVLPDGQF